MRGLHDLPLPLPVITCIVKPVQRASCFLQRVISRQRHMIQPAISSSTLSLVYFHFPPKNLSPFLLGFTALHSQGPPSSCFAVFFPLITTRWVHNTILPESSQQHNVQPTISSDFLTFSLLLLLLLPHSKLLPLITRRWAYAAIIPMWCNPARVAIVVYIAGNAVAAKDTRTTACSFLGLRD